MRRWMIAVGAIALLLAGANAHGQTMNVQVRETVLRDRPSFLGTTLTTLQYGDQVVVSGEQAGWSRAASGGAQGWVHSSALTKRRITPVAGGQVGTAASADELALAGKGFSKEVEAEYKAQNKDVDFTEVDRMERIVISEQEMRQFLAEGRVGAAQGGVL